MATAAERQKKYRERRGAGKIVVQVTVDAVDMAEELIAKGWLDPRDADDPRAIGRALERAHVQVLPRGSHP